MSRRSESLKKRHTKPCKFFQLNRCPHTAEVCDFAHVVPSAFSLDASSPMCRYYYAGHCANGSLCKYRHGGALSPLSPQQSPDGAEDWASMGTSGPVSPNSPLIYKTFSTYSQRWPTMSTYSSAPFSPQSPESLIFSPSTRSRDSIQSLDTVSTTNTSLESDDAVIVTVDPQYEEHAHSHQSQICITDEPSVIHVSPYHHGPLLYVNTTQPPLLSYDYAAYIGGMKGKSMFKGKSRSGSSKSPSKQKALKFKTKPCKFWSTETGCPNGSACTFIHDEDISRSPSPPPPKSATSEKGDSASKGFMPIPWRVIGGGVRVSTAKIEGDDSLPFNPDVDCSLPSKPANISLPPLKIITRPRSNSIPPTPSITQVKVEHLFSAESPGVL